MIITIVIVVVIALGLVGFFVTGFNRLRQADVQTDEALGGIDVQLTRRAELIPNLVNSVKGYAEHERSVFEEVTAARAQAARAVESKSVAERVVADERMTNALVDVMAVAEAYPDLKASTNFLDLQNRLNELEGALAFARQYYNDAVSKQNTLVRTIPWMFFSRITSVGQREFYEAPDVHQAPPSVQF